MEYLGDNLSSKKNNFDFMRMVAAMLVVISHAFPISLGDNSIEPLNILTNNQLTFGTLGVNIFFIISGFLVLHSFMNRKSVKGFLRARFLRLFPGLFVVTLIVAFIMGPFVTTVPLSQYFRDSNFWHFLRNVSIFWIQNDLPGVFTTNPLPFPNGSLWTIPFEAKSYLVLLIAGILGFYRRRYLILALFLFSIWSDERFFTLFRYFAAGMIFYLYRQRISLRIDLLVLSLIGIIVANYFGLLNKMLPFFGAYVILYICLSSTIPLQKFGKYGDFSYGVYIYAFPIQQLVRLYHGENLNPWSNSLLSIPLILICAVLSWKLVEHPCLQLKNRYKT